ncbi:MAG: hypothetical protein LBM74_09390 [Oscillospiraceae bacterium]|jgi:hypothetical protein|nr:hypothetical protein [Oscillospiraceae bacterium]
MKTNLHIPALGAISAVLVALFSLLFLVVDVTALFVAAYALALLGILAMWAAGFWLLKTPQAYPWGAEIPKAAAAYWVTEVIVSAAFVVLEQVGIFALALPWFLLIQAGILAIFAVRVILLHAGTREIEQVEGTVKAQMLPWKSLVLDAEAILLRTPDASKTDVQRAVDALKYADPMQIPALAPYDESIRASIARLDAAVSDSDAAAVSALCAALQGQIKDRNARLKAAK